MIAKSEANVFLAATIFVVITICYFLGIRWLFGPSVDPSHGPAGIGEALLTTIFTLCLSPPTSIIAYKKLRIESKTSRIYFPIAFCATALAIVIALPLLNVFGAGIMPVIGIPTIIGLIIGRKLSEERNSTARAKDSTHPFEKGERISMKLSRETIDTIALPVIYIMVLGVFLGLHRYIFHGSVGSRSDVEMISLYVSVIFFLVLVPAISFIALIVITKTIKTAHIFFTIVAFVVLEFLILNRLDR